MPDVDDGEEQRARAAFAALNDIAVGALKIHVLPHHANTASCAWHRDFMVALDAHAAKVGDMSKAEIIIPSMDLLVPHYPSFLWECRRWPGGHGRFAEERCQRMGEMWVRIIPEMRARMSAAQRLLVFDLESNISQCSAFAHEQKLQLGGDPRIVHISICLDASSYRPGKDISFPACLPAAFGDAAVRAVPPARREIFFSFRGSGRRMPLREQILAMHNGTDRVCLDAHPHRSQLQAASEAATGVRVPPQSDDEYVALHARSRFSLCPRGDAVYSFRFVEALSCGAIPVLYGDGWVLPFSELVDYHDFAVVIAEDDVASTPKVLAAIGPAQLEAMQRSGRAVFERLIGSVPAQLDAVLDILRARRQADSSSRPSSRDHAGDAITTRHQVGELAECFQWKPDANCDSGLDQWEEKKKVHLGEELADVTCYLVRLADKCGVDLPGAISNKLAKNAAKYPADRVRGSSAKYDEYKEYHQHQQASDGASKA